MGIFQTLRAANSAVPGRIWSKFELIQAVKVVLFTCKNEEDPIKKGRRYIGHKNPPLLVYGNFPGRSRAANAAVRGEISANFGLIRELMVELVTCKNEKRDNKQCLLDTPAG